MHHVPELNRPSGVRGRPLAPGRAGGSARLGAPVALAALGALGLTLLLAWAWLGGERQPGVAEGAGRSTTLERRLERDRGALRARIAELEASGNHDRLVARVGAMRAGPELLDGFVDLEGWAVGRHELKYVHEINRPPPARPKGPIMALDFGRENHPLHVITRYARQLRERGIDLLVVPVPNRVQLWADRLPGGGTDLSGASGASGASGGAGDLGSARLLLALCEAGVEVVDLTPVFAAERARSADGPEGRTFREHNPHWSPRGVVVCADVLAERIRAMDWFEPGPARAGEDFSVQHERRAHVFHEQGAGAGAPPTYSFECVLDAAGSPVDPRDRQSPILVIGDSFTAIYRPEGADIASQLYARLGLRMDCISIASGGANTVWKTLARRRDDLAGKRLVVWIFRMSEFQNLDFQSVPIFSD